MDQLRSASSWHIATELASEALALVRQISDVGSHLHIKLVPRMRRAIQTFEVSLKAFIVRDARILLLQEADTGYWELPGGRIDVGEERLPQTDILAREIREELGAEFRCDVGPAAVTWVRERPTDRAFLFIVARLCQYDSGPIVLSGEHASFKWTTPQDWASLTFPPLSDYQNGLDQLWQLARMT